MPNRDLTPTGINDAGEIVGHYLDTTGVHGFLYNNAKFATLDDPFNNSTHHTIITGINNLGQVVGYTIDGDTFYGFEYANGTFTTLPFDGIDRFDNPFVPSAINDAGQIVGTGGPGGVVYQSGRFTVLTDYTGRALYNPFGINGFGQIVASNFGPGDAFVFNPSAVQNNILRLDDAPQFTGKIAGFAPGDQIDLTDINDATLVPLKYTPNSSSTGGSLTVNDGTHVAHLQLLGQYIAAGFTPSADSGTGTIITYAPPAAQLAEAFLAASHHS